MQVWILPYLIYKAVSDSSFLGWSTMYDTYRWGWARAICLGWCVRLGINEDPNGMSKDINWKKLCRGCGKCCGLTPFKIQFYHDNKGKIQTEPEQEMVGVFPAWYYRLPNTMTVCFWQPRVVVQFTTNVQCCASCLGLSRRCDVQNFHNPNSQKGYNKRWEWSLRLGFGT